jgi:hypothetical protein
MKPKHRRWTAPLAWLAAGLIVAVSPWAAAEDTASPAGDEIASPTGDENAPQEPQPAAAGLTIFVDPETGEIVDQPTAAQKAALSEALRRSLDKSSEGLEAFELLYGGHGVHLQGRFRSAVIARMRADGSFEIRCADHPDEAAVLLAGPAPAAAAEWVEK